MTDVLLFVVIVEPIPALDSLNTAWKINKLGWILGVVKITEVKLALWTPACPIGNAVRDCGVEVSMHIDYWHNRISHRSKSKERRAGHNTNGGQRQGGVGGKVVGKLAPVGEARCMDS